MPAAAPSLSNRPRCAHAARRAGCGAAVVAVLAALSREAAADRFVTLRWSAPPDCPPQSAVEAEVARLLAGAKNPPDEPLTAAADVTREASGFRVHLEITREGGNNARDVRGSTCAAVADAAALILAMTIDPEAASRAPPAPSASPSEAPANPPDVGAAGSQPGTTSAPPSPRSAAPPSPSPPRAPSEPSARTRAVTARSSTPARPSAGPQSGDRRLGVSVPSERPASRIEPRLWRLSAGAVGDVGTMQGAAAAIELGAAVVPGPLRLDGDLEIWPSSSATAPDDARAGGSLDLVAGSVSACLAIPALARAVGPRFEIGLPCIGGEMGRMHAQGYGVSSPGEGDWIWAAVRAGAAGAWVAEPWFDVRLRFEAVAPLVRPRFVLENVGEVHQPGPAGRAALSLELRF